MPIPYSYADFVPLDGGKMIPLNDLAFRISLKLKKNEPLVHLHYTLHGFYFTYKSLFSIPYQIEISENKQNKEQVFYEIRLNKLINVSIALVVFTAFFSSFGMTGFLWFSAILTISFYAIAVMVVNNQVRDLIKKSMGENGNMEWKEEILSKEQLQWLEDKTKCPACGEEITEFDKYCPECGLKIREKVKNSPFNISKYGNRRIKYSFKEKKHK